MPLTLLGGWWMSLCLALPPITVPEDWLTWTMRAESGGDRMAIGDGGRSRGPYQIQRHVWEHYSRKPWIIYAHDPVVSRRVARDILRDCIRKCQRVGKPVTFRNVRYYYTHGGF